MPIFLIEDEEYAESFDIIKDEDYILANDVFLEAKSDDYQRGYMNALSTQQRQYLLRSRDVLVSPIHKRKDVHSKNDLSNNQKKGKEHVYQNPSKVN